jgi:hypothetical protein
MSVNVSQFLGYTVELKKDLTQEDFEFFDKFEVSHKQNSSL